MNKVNYTLLSYLNSTSSIFIIVNVIVSVVGFIRSFCFMNWLDMEELGLISLIQTVIQFIGMFQLGFINGGYRLFCLNKVEEQEKVNNLLFTFIFFLLIILCFSWFILDISGIKIILDSDFLFVSILCGIIQLTSNWMSNTLIGKQKYKCINFANLTSAFLSFIFLLLVYVWSIYGAIISILVQPFLYSVIVLCRNRDIRPTGFFFDIKTCRVILGYGFIPFLAGIMVMINLQLERWSIAAFLGTEELGCYYLAFLYYMLFQLIPNSIQSLYFPRAVAAYENNDRVLFYTTVKKQSVVLFIYDFVVLFATVLFFQFFVDLLFPAHSGNTIYVYYILPGLLFYSMEYVASMILNAAVKLKPQFWGGLLSVFVNLIMIIMLSNTEMSLTNMAILKSLVLAIPVIVEMFYILINKSKLFGNYSN